MAKYHGKIGFAESKETPPDSGIWVNEIVEKPYLGDVVKNIRKLESGEGLNDNVVVSNSISIVANAYAINNFFAIRYAEWMGVRWIVSDVEVQHPRLILRLGGVYNGPKPSEAP